MLLFDNMWYFLFSSSSLWHNSGYFFRKKNAWIVTRFLTESKRGFLLAWTKLSMRTSIFFRVGLLNMIAIPLNVVESIECKLVFPCLSRWQMLSNCSETELNAYEIFRTMNYTNTNFWSFDWTHWNKNKLKCCTFIF